MAASPPRQIAKNKISIDNRLEMIEGDNLAGTTDTGLNATRQNRVNLQNGQSSTNVNPTTIFDEAHECLAQSLLMFLYSDLRLLSATGRINTKYETLCIASDRVPRTSAAGLAQLPGMNDFVNDDDIESVSPAQIMAILIVELRQEVIAQRKLAKEQIKRRGERRWFEIESESDEDLEEDDDAGVMSKITDSNGRKEFETDMHAMVRAYNDMLRKDLKGIPEVKVTFSNPFSRSLEPKEVENTPSKYTRQTLQVIKKFKDGLQGKNIEKAEAKPEIRNTVSHDEYSRCTSDGVLHKKMFQTPTKSKLDDVFEEKAQSSHSSSTPNLNSLSALNLDERSTPSPQDNPHRDKHLAHSDIKGYHSKLYDFLESVKGMKTSHNPGQNVEEVMSDPGVSCRDESSTQDAGYPLSLIAPSKKQTLSKQISTYIEKAKEDHALYNKYFFPTDDYNTFTRAEDVGNAIFNDMPPKRRISVINETVSFADDEDADRNMNETELMDFMTKCINSRDDTKLSFMKDFFKEDSPSATMVKSHAKIVWVNDWYTVKVRCKWINFVAVWTLYLIVRLFFTTISV